MKKILVSNIQEFSLDDGEGLRTTVFLKGCPIHCPWCSNPENIAAGIEPCLLICAENDTVQEIGRYYTQEDLFQAIMKDQFFWHEKGGITFSGGEPFLQLVNCADLLKFIKKKEINITVETSLYVENEYVVRTIPWIDYLYIDFKILNIEKSKEILGGNYTLFENNLGYISQHAVNYTARFPVVKRITDTPENIRRFIELLVEYKPLEVEIFSVHNLAAEKYQRLGKEYHYFEQVNIEELNIIKERIHRETGLPVKVLSI